MTMRADDRGVSEVVGFVLAFSIILASGAIVATIGFDQIQEARDDEQKRTAENGMIELAESYEYLLERTDDQRRAGLALNGGSLQLEQSTLSVTVDGETTPIEVWSVQHTVGDRRIVYEGGGVFAGEAGIVSYRPSVSCRDDTAIVSLLSFDDTAFYLSRGNEDFRILEQGQELRDGEFSLSDVNSISDEGAVMMEVNYEGSTVVERRTFDSPQTVSIDLTDSAHTVGWKQFAGRYDVGWDVAGDSLECTASRVLVRSSTVSVQMSGT